MFDALDNFRDFGGYPTRNGRRTVTGRLYRSAHHAEVSDADLDRLHNLGVSVFVDLRRTSERTRMPCRRPPRFAGLTIENDIGADEGDAWLAFIEETPDLTADAFRGHMRDFYRDAAFEARHIDLFSRYFDALATADGAVLIHCAAGKDRTGILAALTHHVANVAHEHVIHDYLLTNEDPAMDRRVRSVARYVANATGRELDDATILAGLRVEAEFLELALGEISRRASSIDAYLEEILGVTPGKRQAILERILA
jgi:protein-tyrosine phosphatase